MAENHTSANTSYKLIVAISTRKKSTFFTQF